MGWNEVTGNNTGSKGKVPYTNFEVGNTVIRILDAEPFSFWSHWLQKQKTSITCPGKGCPICNIIAQAKANNETPIYSSTMRHAIRIWNYNTNQMEILIQGKQFFNQLLDFHKEVGDLQSYDIKVKRTGTGKDTSYTMLPQKPTDFDTAEKAIENIDIPEILSAPDVDAILQLIEGKTWDEINGTDAVA